jgi:hypothetical protein
MTKIEPPRQAWPSRWTAAVARAVTVERETSGMEIVEISDETHACRCTR